MFMLGNPSVWLLGLAGILNPPLYCDVAIMVMIVGE